MRNLLEPIAELFKYREVLFMLTWKDIAIRYKQSVMGLLWAAFTPTIVVLSGVVVRFAFAHVSGKPLVASDIVSVSVKSVPWAFVVSAVRFSANSLAANANLVSKVYLPRAIFPAAAVLACLFDFLIASMLLAVALAIARVGVGLQLMWVPLLIAILIGFVMGVALFLSAANLFFRDVKYLVDAIVTFAIFFTPVYYDLSMLGSWGRWLQFNPVAPVLEALVECVVHHRMPQVAPLCYSAGASLLLLWLGFRFFKGLEPAFAENV